MSNEKNTAPAEREREPMETHTAGPKAEGMRLDRFAFGAFERLASRKAAYKATKKELLFLDGKTARPHWKIHAGQSVSLYRDLNEILPVYHFKMRVVHEDDWLAILEKPAGIPVSGNYSRTVERALPANITPSPLADALTRSRAVHRLDAPTGGLLIVAKSASAMVELGRLFQQQKVSKTYRGIVTGLLEGEGTVDEPLDGREAVTEYTAVSAVRSLKNGWLTTLELRPRTGRTHQLRRHTACLGHPIVGDKKYGIPGKTLKGKGLFLWAVELRFRHPGLQEEITFCINEPNKFGSLRRRERRRWLKYNPA